jgi:hypothetical protein
MCIYKPIAFIFVTKPITHTFRFSNIELERFHTFPVTDGVMYIGRPQETARES